MPRLTDPVFIIRFEKGLAERNRLPLEQVIKALQEIRQMIIDAGRDIEKERGFEKPGSDFGLELLGEEAGIAFQKGSLRAAVAITKNAVIGVAAASRVLDAVHALGIATHKKPLVFANESEARITHRLERIAYINETTKAQARFEVRGPKAFFADQVEPIRKRAVFGERAVKVLKTLRSPTFVEESARVYGKLSQLKDPYQTDESTTGHFWAELWRDNGEKWRVRFKDEEQNKIVRFWRQQVVVTGTAYYYQTKTPKLEATNAERDEPRDYEAAFTDLFGSERHPNVPFERLLQLRYGE